jgi:serine/threonine-protein kinase
VPLQVKELDPAQFARLSSLFDEALSLPTTGRETWLAALGQRDPDASTRVRALLASLAAARSEGLLEDRTILDARVAAVLGDDDTLTGRQIGPYRVLQPIGHGGMGTVWLAERADGLFERKIALKLVHLSIVGSAAAERFARERTILASLDHPQIAKLLDAGIGPEGQPYLALEYVEGVPLTLYCDARKLEIGARIALFAKVLSAVHYAHTNLVIHRDLKPSNILVTAAGDVRLLDFGIAKLVTRDGEARETELTQLGGRAFTPEYASPEQVAGTSITTASDVYALGVVLYELLCGQRPYAMKRESRAALEEAILEAEPVRPSQSSFTDAAAAARSSTSPALRRALTGDLDTIALKALKKEPSERYASAHEMQQDLERFQRGEPVLARADSSAYRLRKFVARNKLAVAAAAATTLALSIALALALWQASVAREQARVAQSEATRATAVQDFLLNLFQANSVEQPDPIKARQTTARELLDLGGARIDESLKSAPEARATVLDTLADMYYQLGMNAEAAKQRSREVAALKEAHGPNNPQIAYALIKYASDIADLPQRSEVLPTLNEAARILDAANDHASETRGRLLMMLAQANRYSDYVAMQRYADQAVAFFRERYPDSTNLPLAMSYAANARMQQGALKEAEAAFDSTLREVARLQTENSAWAVFPLIGLAQTQDELGKVEAAERSYRTALDIARASYGEFHLETLLSEAKLGAYLQATGRRDEGQRAMAHALASAGGEKGGYVPAFATAVLSGLQGRAFLYEGRLEDAASLMAVDIDDARENFPNSAPVAGALLSQIALDTARGRYDDAAREVDEAMGIVRRIGGIGPSLPNRLLLARSRLLLARGDPANAIATLDALTQPTHSAELLLRVQQVAARTVLSQAQLQQSRITEAIASARDAYDQVTESSLRKFYPRLEADASLRLGEALRAAGESERARPYLEHALALRAQTDDPSSPWIAETQIAVAACLADLGRRREAAALVARARTILARHPEIGAHFAAPLKSQASRIASR